MNVFLLDIDPIESVACYVDDHVAFVTVGHGRKPIRSCKMAIEACQLLSSAHWHYADKALLDTDDRSLWPAPYKPSHPNHPWAVAVRSSREAYLLVSEYAHAILLEHEHRTGKTMGGVQAALDRLNEAPEWLESCGWRVPVCRLNEPTVYVSSVREALPLYRQYYIGKIEKMPRFTGRACPSWATI